MTGLNVTFNIPDVDITLVDPEDPANELAEVFNEYLRAKGRSDLQVDILSAEWEGGDFTLDIVHYLTDEQREKYKAQIDKYKGNL